ncbi:thioredoxin family protein [Microbacterium sp. DWRC1-3]|jgi:thiol-disulfide isomerase/thioredoxin|uniref:thioredoxin family protein n=1 Tax=Microbacterium sp. DWRC1-3 TaxID=2804630 RepID=UPI003CE9260B
MELTLVSSSFCGACARTRTVLAEAARFLPEATVIEIDVAQSPDAAEELDIAFTPTVIIRDAAGAEVFRATGVPTVPQVLTAAVKALPA